jgi:hypothetical protein
MFKGRADLAATLARTCPRDYPSYDPVRRGPPRSFCDPTHCWRHSALPHTIPLLCIEDAHSTKGRAAAPPAHRCLKGASRCLPRHCLANKYITWSHRQAPNIFNFTTAAYLHLFQREQRVHPQFHDKCLLVRMSRPP